MAAHSTGTSNNSRQQPARRPRRSRFGSARFLPYQTYKPSITILGPNPAKDGQDAARRELKSGAIVRDSGFGIDQASASAVFDCTARRESWRASKRQMRQAQLDACESSRGHTQMGAQIFDSRGKHQCHVQGCNAQVEIRCEMCGPAAMYWCKDHFSDIHETDRRSVHHVAQRWRAGASCFDRKEPVFSLASEARCSPGVVHYQCIHDDCKTIQYEDTTLVLPIFEGSSQQCQKWWRS